jgi:hypothetical protein
MAMWLSSITITPLIPIGENECIVVFTTVKFRILAASRSTVVIKSQEFILEGLHPYKSTVV